ncbi:TlyA family RNA methyltransferase [Vreelandella aquamarina]
MQRLDQLLVSLGLASSRTRAQRLIRHGRVTRLDTRKTLTKASEKLPDDIPLQVEEDPEERYVSRAGLKLEAILLTLDKRFDAGTVLDIGQSTGGFSDCALRFGAAQVIGIEVGHGQLDPSLRCDARVICLEGINARRMSQAPEVLAQLHHMPVDAAVMDVSFISQTLILPEIAALLPAGGELLSLVKPQFELTPQAMDKRGVVRNPQHFTEVEKRLRDACTKHGLQVLHWQESPITGSDGNREFLLHAVKC